MVCCFLNSVLSCGVSAGQRRPCSTVKFELLLLPKRLYLKSDVAGFSSRSPFLRGFLCF